MANYKYDFSNLTTDMLALVSTDPTALPSAREAASEEIEHREHPWASYSQVKRIVRDHKRSESMARHRKAGWFGEPLRHAAAARKGHRGGHRGKYYAQTTKGLGPRHKVSRAKDGRRKAKYPGYRRSKSGKVYFENRINRSDHHPHRRSPFKV